MKTSTRDTGKESQPLLLDRRFLTCPECSWVHYVMTAEEKMANDQMLERLVERYQLTKQEKYLYETAFRQCLRCETPASTFRSANDQDLDRAAGHVVTPVFVEPEVGTH